MTAVNLLPLLDLAPEHHSIRDEVLASLLESPKRLSSKYFYDRRGSELFDAICETPEYYPTRTELSIMRDALPEIAEWIGTEAVVIEIGSGSGLKTELLIEALERPAMYVPMDISKQHLLEAAERLAGQHPGLEIAPVCADFMQQLRLPEWAAGSGKRVVYFPGSTLGNLPRQAANDLLRRFADLVQDGQQWRASDGGGLLLGVDLQKDPAVLEAAYDDAAGVTAEFNLNILRHLNRRLECDIPVDAFAHRAPFNPEDQRIEMHLVARRDVVLEIAPATVRVPEGEAIVTEYSHKYAVPDLSASLAAAGWRVEQVWTDPREYFAVMYCELAAGN